MSGYIVGDRGGVSTGCCQKILVRLTQRKDDAHFVIAYVQSRRGILEVDGPLMVSRFTQVLTHAEGEKLWLPT